MCGAVRENCGGIQSATCQKVCSEGGGSIGAKNYPEAEETEEGVDAEAEAAEEEDEAENGTSVSVLAPAAAAR